MAAAQMSSFSDLVVALDYGQFYLHTAASDPDLAVDLLDIAFDAGIAQQDGLVVVLSPHQNNFKMPIRIEVWTAEPVVDLDEWEEAFELHLDIENFGLIYESPTLTSTPIPVPPGSYHALITGRGFVARGWPGSTTPGDSWRIQLWPSSGSFEPVHLRTYVEPTFNPPEATFEPDGVAAAKRIHKVLHDVEPLSGERTTVRVQRRMPGTRRKLFPKFRHVYGWLTSMSGPGDTEFTMGGWLDHPSFGDANHIVPCAGGIACVLIGDNTPAYAEFTWTWFLRPPDRRTADEHEDRPGGPLLPGPPQMTLRFDLDNAEREQHWPTTLVTVTHGDIPAELADDLAAYWQWILERADYGFDLSGERQKYARQIQSNRSRP